MSQWLQTVIQNHAQTFGISEHHSQVMSESLLAALIKYRVTVMPTYIDDSMWQSAKAHAGDLDYRQAAALYQAFVQDYTQRK
tara:strand:+ start:6516 stop:6761 length:246 start_codon:yes stop_codon:yes gene_type:complete